MRRLHADGSALLHQDLRGERVVQDRAASLADRPVHRDRELVRAVTRDIRGVHDVLVHQRRVKAELQILHVHAHVAPVGREDLLRLERHFQLAEHDRRGIVGALEEVRVLLHHDLRVGFPARRGHGGVGGHDAVRQIEELLHGFAAAGDVFLHLVDVGLLSEGHDRVDLLLALAVDDQPVGLREPDPVHLRAVGVDQRADLLARVRLADVAELVQGGLELEAAAAEARGEAAGQIVLLDQQRLEAAAARGRRRRQSAVAGADDDDVILPVQMPFLLIFFIRFFSVPPGGGGAFSFFTACPRTAGSAR